MLLIDALAAHGMVVMAYDDWETDEPLQDDDRAEFHDDGEGESVDLLSGMAMTGDGEC
jgi:hypothetical protein